MRFNIRIYGLLINQNEEILISHEVIKDRILTKFPGGGLEFNEGIADCLKREFQEEMGISIELKELYYVNDFLQISAFNASEQVILIYYLISSDEISEIKTKSQSEILGFEWKKIIEIIPKKDFTFPIDQIVSEKIKNKKNNKN